MGDATHELAATTMMATGRTPIDRKFCGFMSVSRSLQVVAVGLLLLIVVATVHQLMTLRAAIVGDTARQMARLDMVAAQKGLDLRDSAGRHSKLSAQHAAQLLDYYLSRHQFMFRKGQP